MPGPARPNHQASPTPTPRSRRRRLLLGAAAFVILLVALVSWTSWRVQRDTYSPVLREVTIPVPGLTHEVTVLQISDLGADRFGVGQSKLAELIGDRHFDAVVMTGDIGDDTGDYEAIWELTRLAASHTDETWYLPGNHDTPQVGQGLAERGVHTLPTDRAVAFVEDDPSGDQIALVYGKSSATIQAAEGKGTVLLVVASHTPPSASRLAAGSSLGGGVHLFIAGHTHGGQVQLPLVGAVWAPMSWEGEERIAARGNEITFLPELRGRFVDGMYDADGQLVFVSRGLEQTVLGQRRFLARAEIVEYRFVPE